MVVRDCFWTYDRFLKRVCKSLSSIYRNSSIISPKLAGIEYINALMFFDIIELQSIDPDEDYEEDDDCHEILVWRVRFISDCSFENKVPQLRDNILTKYISKKEDYSEILNNFKEII